MEGGQGDCVRPKKQPQDRLKAVGGYIPRGEFQLRSAGRLPFTVGLIGCARPAKSMAQGFDSPQVHSVVMVAFTTI